MANLTNSAKLIQEMAKKANKTELPEVNNSTVNFTINGSTWSQSMTTNQPNNSTVNLTVTKATVWLGNVDNTSDANKPISTATKAALDLKADKSDLSSVYKYKWSVASYSNLPSAWLTAWDVYNVSDSWMNYAWTGSAWDALGSTVDLSNYLAKNNTTAFTPAGDYNPATKKYVDDNTKAISWIWTTQPSNPVAWSTYYDTTAWTLKVYNWTAWEEVGWGNVIAMTQAEYEALPEATKNDGKLRIITDAPQIELPDVSSVSWTTTTQPSDPVAGSIYFDTTAWALKVYNWTAWQEVGSNWWWIQIAPNSPIKPKYTWYGTEEQYAALTQYYTDEEWDTEFHTF